MNFAEKINEAYRRKTHNPMTATAPILFSLLKQEGWKEKAGTESVRLNIGGEKNFPAHYVEVTPSYSDDRAVVYQIFSKEDGGKFYDEINEAALHTSGESTEDPDKKAHRLLDQIHELISRDLDIDLAGV